MSRLSRFSSSRRSLFSSHQAHRPWKSLPAWMSSWPCRGCAVDQPFSGLSRTTSLEQNCRRQHVQNSAMQTVNVSQHEVMMSESKARTIRFCYLSCTLMHELSADSCSLCDASHSGSRAAAPSATLLIPSRAQREARSAMPHKVVAAFELPRAQQASSSCRFWKTGPSATWRASSSALASGCGWLPSKGSLPTPVF